MVAGTRTLFTVDEANRLLPLVRSIAHDLVAEFRSLRTAGRERRSLEVETAGSSDAERRIEALKTHVAECSSRVEGYLHELQDLGLEVRDLELGLVDFPTLMGSEPAYLCWRLGEESVAWWHAIDKGYSDRTPLVEKRAILPGPG
jgi:hypothetical protein